MDSYLTNTLKFVRSRFHGYLYILREGDNWFKLINYVDDALNYSNNEDFRMKFERSLKKIFNLSLLGQAKWYLGMKIKNSIDYITLDQETIHKEYHKQI